MQVVDPGHIYDLTWLDLDPHDLGPIKGRLEFVKREGENYPGNGSSYPGTTTQEVLRALIDRIQYVDRQIPCMENVLILFHLRRAIYLLEERAAKRHGREFPKWKDIKEHIEIIPVCSKCGHIGCEGMCHAES